LNDRPNQGIVLAAGTQVLREYLAVATRPVAVNGLGLATADALANVAAFRGRMRLCARRSRRSSCETRSPRWQRRRAPRRAPASVSAQPPGGPGPTRVALPPPTAAWEGRARVC